MTHTVPHSSPICRYPSHRTESLCCRLIVSAILLLFLCVTALNAQPRSRVPPTIPAPGQLNEAEGKAVIHAFRTARYEHDYSFHFELRHYPRRGSTVRRAGQAWGSWNQIGPVNRIRLFDETDALALELIVQNGPADVGGVWRVARSEGKHCPERIEGDAIHEALFPGMVISPFDLQMPFVYWDDYAYEGPDRVRGRPVHHFLLYPPEDETGPDRVAAVRMTLDAGWNAMLRAQYLDEAGEVLRTLQVLSVRRVDHEWIARAMDVIDEQSREKTRLRIQAARMDLRLPRDFFQPETVLPEQPGPERETFQEF